MKKIRSKVEKKQKWPKKSKKIFVRGALYIMFLLDAEFDAEYNVVIGFSQMLSFKRKKFNTSSS